MQKAAKTRAKAGNSGKITGPEQKIAVGRKGERRKPGAAKQRDHHCRTPQMPDYWVSQAHPIYAWVRTRHAKSPARFPPGPLHNFVRQHFMHDLRNKVNL